jgi:hypothetical protein
MDRKSEQHLACEGNSRAILHKIKDYVFALFFCLVCMIAPMPSGVVQQCVTSCEGR